MFHGFAEDWHVLTALQQTSSSRIQTTGRLALGQVLTDSMLSKAPEHGNNCKLLRTLTCSTGLFNRQSPFSQDSKCQKCHHVSIVNYISFSKCCNCPAELPLVPLPPSVYYLLLLLQYSS